jgi:hypothetical protein
MRLAELLPKIVNLQEVERTVGTPLRTMDAIRNHGYRIVKARDRDEYYLAKATDLQPLLVRLGDIAEVRRGFTTGANEFFYLEPVGVRVADLLRGTDSPVRAEGGTDSPVRAEGGTDILVRAEGGTDSPVRAEGGLDSPVRAEGGTDILVRAEGGLDSPVRAEGGTDILVRAEGGTDSPVRTEGGLDSPVRAEGGTDILVRAEGGTDIPVRAEGGLDSPVRASEGLDRNVQATTVRVCNGAGWEGEIEASWLRPVIKSPRELKTLRVRPEDLRYLVFLPPDELRGELAGGWQSRYPLAWAYIQWGEAQGYHRNPTCAAREVWWGMVTLVADCAAVPARHQKRYFVVHNPYAFCLNKSFYGIKAKVEVLACLMSHFSQLSAELVGRTPGGGGGPLDLDVNMVEQIYVPNPAAFTDEQRERLLNAFEQMAQREVKSIFEELGLPKPNRDFSNIRPEDVSLDRVLPDRRALDRVVFEVLGLSESEQLEVYRSVVELVRNRLVKARSVG